MKIGQSIFFTWFRFVAFSSAIFFLFFIFFEGDGFYNEDDRKNLRTIRPVDSAIYKLECGSCHLAYPAGLLPERSWVRLLEGLSDHFGDTIELEPKISAEIREYLETNSAEKGGRRSKKIAESIPIEESPIRFTDTKFYRVKHQRIRNEVYKDRRILSRANCQACHLSSESGYFSGLDVSVQWGQF